MCCLLINFANESKVFTTVMIFLKEIEIGLAIVMPSVHNAIMKKIKQKLINYYSKMVLLRESILIKLKKNPAETLIQPRIR